MKSYALTYMIPEVIIARAMFLWLKPRRSRVQKPRAFVVSVLAWVVVFLPAFTIFQRDMVELDARIGAPVGLGTGLAIWCVVHMKSPEKIITITTAPVLRKGPLSAIRTDLEIWKGAA